MIDPSGAEKCAADPLGAALLAVAAHKLGETLRTWRGTWYGVPGHWQMQTQVQLEDASRGPNLAARRAVAVERRPRQHNR